MIAQGDKLPDAVLTELTEAGMQNLNTSELFAGKTVVLFAVPGAFTPTCSEAHLPGYVVLADELKARGVDMIVCLAVNDAFVMRAWGKVHNASELRMLADGDASFTRALGLEMDTGSFGGVRSVRYAMIVRDGVVEKLNIEQAKSFEVSKAEYVLAQL
ncbi:peroxiredoxin [Shewanella corallii]|uniref:Glutathione-dependent peroxiredoxin n=2 Tax=Shewanella TaxID=22 RepID=A0ABT0N9M6_9GAMM|nr:MULTISPECIES: peroxiredoxin [Shewanella]MCL1038838.1 peroxiredoxin [Shewanella submarina]MCL2915158.1 peroxiredoxin [Shewanella corallii]